MNSLVNAPGSFFAGSGVHASAAGGFSLDSPMNSLVNDPGAGSAGIGDFGGAGGAAGLWPPSGDPPSTSPKIASVASCGLAVGAAGFLCTGSNVFASRNSRVNSPPEGGAAAAGASSKNAAVTPPISSEALSTGGGGFDGPLFARNARNSSALNSAVSSPAGPLAGLATGVPGAGAETPGDVPGLALELENDW